MTLSSFSSLVLCLLVRLKHTWPSHRVQALSSNTTPDWRGLPETKIHIFWPICHFPRRTFFINYCTWVLAGFHIYYLFNCYLFLTASSKNNIFIKKISDHIIEFTDTIRPVCLPFRAEDAIDDKDIPEGLFVNTASWGTSVPMLSNSYFCHQHCINIR